MQVERDFFAREAPVVARELLGSMLVRELPSGDRLSGRVIETEAYHGPDDTGSHARAGITARTTVMFGPPGFAYVYLIYGMYDMLNVTTDEDGFPSAVLIRAVEPVEGIEIMHELRGGKLSSLTNGPGKLCRAMNISRELHGIDLTARQALWFEYGTPLSEEQIGRDARIGIDYADLEHRERPWRFFEKGNKWVSR